MGRFNIWIPPRHYLHLTVAGDMSPPSRARRVPGPLGAGFAAAAEVSRRSMLFPRGAGVGRLISNYFP